MSLLTRARWLIPLKSMRCESVLSLMVAHVPTPDTVEACPTARPSTSQHRAVTLPVYGGGTWSLDDHVGPGCRKPVVLVFHRHIH